MTTQTDLKTLNEQIMALREKTGAGMMDCKKALTEACGNYEKAIEKHRRAVEMDPRHPTAYNNLGHAYEMLNRFPDARAAYQTAVEINPSLSVAHENLANILLEQNEIDNAIAELQKALELDPNNSMIRQNYELFKEINDRANRRNSS